MLDDKKYVCKQKHILTIYLNFVHAEEMQPKELLDTYLQMLYEYMQRRSKLNNEQFQKVVEQSNSEEMVAEFKTVFQVAREEGKEEGLAKGLELSEAKAKEAVQENTRNFIKTLILSTRMSDILIAGRFNVKEELVKTIRAEIKAAKVKKTTKVEN